MRAEATLAEPASFTELASFTGPGRAAGPRRLVGRADALEVVVAVGCRNSGFWRTFSVKICEAVGGGWDLRRRVWAMCWVAGVGCVIGGGEGCASLMLLWRIELRVHSGVVVRELWCCECYRYGCGRVGLMGGLSDREGLFYN